MRKVVAPQRDMLNALLSQRVDVPGMTKEHEPYFRDLYDNMIKINEMVDSHRDLVVQHDGQLHVAGWPTGRTT